MSLMLTDAGASDLGALCQWPKRRPLARVDVSMPKDELDDRLVTIEDPTGLFERPGLDDKLTSRSCEGIVRLPRSAIQASIERRK
jgi:hypothetical protein